MPAARPYLQSQGHDAHAATCPRCHGAVDRVPRRFVDRLLSLVTPVHRYRCQRFDCQWEGLMRPPRGARTRAR